MEDTVRVSVALDEDLVAELEENGFVEVPVSWDDVVEKAELEVMH